jgi:DNA-binding transcriptional LysR family regulator
LIQYETAKITKTEDDLYRWWREQFCSPLPNIVTVDSIEACIQMVSHGLGWCVVPKIHLGKRRSLFSCPVVWRDGHTMLRKTLMIYRSKALEQPVNKLFIDHVLREYSSG